MEGYSKLIALIAITFINVHQTVNLEELRAISMIGNTTILYYKEWQKYASNMQT